MLTDAVTTRSTTWNRRGFSNAAEARQTRRTDSGTNSFRQRSHYHDLGPSDQIAAPSAEDILRISRRTASELRLYDIGDQVAIVDCGIVRELTITTAYTDGRGRWVYDFDSYTARPVTQHTLQAQPLPVDYVAAQLAVERDQLLALKRGSRRHEIRQNK